MLQIRQGSSSHEPAFHHMSCPEIYVPTNCIELLQSIMCALISLTFTRLILSTDHFQLPPDNESNLWDIPAQSKAKPVVTATYQSSSHYRAEIPHYEH